MARARTQKLDLSPKEVMEVLERELLKRELAADVARTTARGARPTIVPPHAAASPRCKHCGTYHTPSQHWSHAAAGGEPGVSSYLCPGCGTMVPMGDEAPPARTQKVARKRSKPKKKAAKKRTTAKPIRWAHADGTKFEAVPKRTEVTGYELYMQPPGKRKTNIGLFLTLPDARAAGEAYIDGLRTRAAMKKKAAKAKPKRKRSTTKKKPTTKSATKRKTATKRKKAATKKPAAKKTTTRRTQKVATKKKPATKKAAPRKKAATRKKTAAKKAAKRISKATTKAARPRPSGTKSAASSAAVTWKRAAPGAYSGSWFGPGAMRLFSARKDNVTGEWVLLVGEGGAVPTSRIGPGDYATLSAAKKAAERVVRGARGALGEASPSRTATKAKPKAKRATSKSKRATAVVPVTWQQTAPGAYSGAMYGPNRMTLFSAREDHRGRWELLVDEGGFSADKKVGTFPSLAEAQQGAASYVQKGKAKVTGRRKRPKTGKPPAAPKELVWTEVAPGRYSGAGKGHWFSVFRNGGRRWKLLVGKGRLPDTLVGEYASRDKAKQKAEAFLREGGERAA